MVTTAQAVGVLFPTAVPLVDFIVSDNVITYWNNAIGTQPSSAALAAVTQAQADAATRNAAIIQLRPNNLLVNGGFDVVQRATGSVANTAYGFDRWKVFTQSDVISCGQVATTPEPASSVNTISLATVTTQRFGIAQIVESSKSICYRGRTVTFQFVAYSLVSAKTVEFAILEWQGTADAVTANLINDWTSSTYNPGNFFVSSHVNLVAQGEVALASGSPGAAKLCSLTGIVSSGCNNLIVILWTKDQVVFPDGLAVKEAGLYESKAALQIWTPRSLTEETLECFRYHYEAPAMPGGGVVTGATNALSRFTAPLPVRMRVVPTTTVTHVGIYDGTSTPVLITLLGTNYSTVDYIQFDVGLSGACVPGHYAVCYDTASPASRWVIDAEI